MLHRFVSFIKTYQLPILSGILIGTSYIPLPPWALLFCFAPLWLFIYKSDSLKQSLIGGWLTSFILTLIGFYWVAYVIREHGHMPWALAIPGMILFCAISTYYVPLCCGLITLLKVKKGWQLKPFWFFLFIAITFGLIEKIRYTLFPWNLGYAWYWGQWPGYHLAEWIGFDGLSSLNFLFNAGFALACFYVIQQNKKRGLKIGAATLAAFIGFQLCGFYVGKNLAPYDDKMNILMIQGNIGNLEKERAEKGSNYRTMIIDKYLNLAQSSIDRIGAENIDFMVFPETAMPVFISKYSFTKPRQKKIAEFVKKNKIPLITGAYYHNTRNDQVSNSLFVFNVEGKTLGLPYRKTNLLAFGEYIPIIEHFPALEKLFGVGSFARGEGPERKTLTTITGKDFHLGPQVCYDGLFPLFSKGLSDHGAQFFVNLTNDSWFGPLSEPYQHLYMTLARGIEFRRPVVRSTNTGITTVSLADGKVLEKSKMFTEQSLYFQVDYHRQPKTTVFQGFPFISELFLTFLLGLFTLYNKSLFVKKK